MLIVDLHKYLSAKIHTVASETSYGISARFVPRSSSERSENSMEAPRHVSNRRCARRAVSAKMKSFYFFSDLIYIFLVSNVNIPLNF